jgi:5-oxoprolinase (ATP-hydrolysing) subunit A
MSAWVRRPPTAWPMAPVILNMDVGELGDEPEEFYALAHLVHVACGGHTGDQTSMTKAVLNSLKHGTHLGAHPSYPDRANFGRRAMALGDRELLDSLTEQLSGLASVAQTHNCPMVSVKAHGALYHDLARSPALAAVYLDAVVDALGATPSVVGPPGSQLALAASERSLVYWAEGFADRAKASDGTLLPRTNPNALITDPSLCVSEAQKLARNGRFQTLCVHGDTPGALELARGVRRALDAEIWGDD